LSDTAKAGIGAGAGVLAVAIIAVVLLLFRRRRRGLGVREKGVFGDDASADGGAGTGRGGQAGSVAQNVVPSVAAAAGRGHQETGGAQERPADELQGPWSEYMARWAANQEDWAAYQAGAQQDGLPGDGDPQHDDTHAGALPVDGRTPQDVARLEDTALAVKPPDFASDDDHDFEALGDMKPRVSEDSTLESPLPRDEKN
jgi:hypothetical protein